MQRMDPPRDGMVLKFVRWVTHPKTGQRIYPKTGKVFPIWVDAQHTPKA